MGDEDMRSSCEGSSSSALRFRLLGGVVEKLTASVSWGTWMEQKTYWSNSALDDSCPAGGERTEAFQEQRSYF